MVVDPTTLYGQTPLGTGYLTDTHSEMHGRTLGIWENAQAYGVVADGTTNDLTALQAAVTATPDGGTLHLPPGKMRIASTWTINKRINVIGSGPRSTIWLDVGAGNDGVVFDTGATYEGVKIGNFAVAGGAASCKDAVVFRKLIRSSVRDLWVKAGGENGVRFDGCLINDIRTIYCTVNYALPFDGVVPTHGVYFADYDATPPNANKIHAVIEGLPGHGLRCITTAQDGGNIWISGTYESNGDSVAGTQDIYMEGCNHFTIKDCHVEGPGPDGGIKVVSSHDGHIGPGMVVANLPLTLDGCTRVKLAGVYGDAVTINSNCEDIEIGRLQYSNFSGAFTDNGARTTVTGNIRNTSATNATLTKTGLADPINLIRNGGAERWSGASPINWSITGTGAKTGDGQADTVKRFGKLCCKVTGGSSGVEVAIPADKVTHVSDRWITTSAWVRIPSGQGANAPGLYLSNDCDGSAFSTPATTATDTWTQLILKTLVPGNTALVLVRVTNQTVGSGVFYVEGISTVVGQAAPIAPPPLVGSDIQARWGQDTFAGAATKVVAFDSAEADTSFYISITGNVNETFWVTAKTTAGFTLNSSNATSTAVVDWVMHR